MIRCYVSAVEARRAAILYGKLHMAHVGDVAVRASCIREYADVRFNKEPPSAHARELL